MQLVEDYLILFVFSRVNFPHIQPRMVSLLSCYLPIFVSTIPYNIPVLSSASTFLQYKSFQYIDSSLAPCPLTFALNFQWIPNHAELTSNKLANLLVKAKAVLP